MSDWREQIEAQIEFLRQDMMYHEAADDMQALLDVAAAADEVSKCKGQTLLGCAPDNDYPNVPEDEQIAHMYGAYKAFNQCAGIVNPALNKLREVGDE